MHRDEHAPLSTYRSDDVRPTVLGEHFRAGDRHVEDARHGYDRSEGPERGRQGYPGSTEERFGSDAYDDGRLAGQGFERRDLARQDQDRHDLGQEEYERRGFGGDRPDVAIGDEGSDGMIRGLDVKASGGQTDDQPPGSEGDPSRSGAPGSDTGKVEVTGDESGSTHDTPSARDD